MKRCEVPVVVTILVEPGSLLQLFQPSTAIIGVSNTKKVRLRNVPIVVQYGSNVQPYFLVVGNIGILAMDTQFAPMQNI